jgi:predicted kinase
MNTNITLKGKVAILMMGAPGSGKSFVATKHYGSYKVLDADKIKESHADYDPKNPSVLHEWSAKVLEEQFQEAIVKDESFVLDGTGANSDKMIRRINEVRAHGFKVALVYVVVALKTSLARNAARTRVVPEYVVIEKYNEVNISFNNVAPHVDQIIVINND